MSVILREYAIGAGADIIIPMIKAGSQDFAEGGDWTPAAGDVKVSKNGGGSANIGTLPVFIADIGWKYVFTNAELTAARVNVNIVDAAGAEVEDQHIMIETYGDASAQHAFNLNVAGVSAADLIDDMMTEQLADGYAANGVLPTLQQALIGLYQQRQQFSISGTTYTVFKINGVDVAFAMTMNDPISATAMSRP